MSIAPVNKPLFDAEGVEFNVDVAVGNDILPCRARCNIGFGYTSWYADCVWISSDFSDVNSRLDLDALGPRVVTSIESQALALWAQRNTT